MWRFFLLLFPVFVTDEYVKSLWCESGRYNKHAYATIQIALPSIWWFSSLETLPIGTYCLIIIWLVCGVKSKSCECQYIWHISLSLGGFQSVTVRVFTHSDWVIVFGLIESNDSRSLWNIASLAWWDPITTRPCETWHYAPMLWIISPLIHVSWTVSCHFCLRKTFLPYKVAWCRSETGKLYRD